MEWYEQLLIDRSGIWWAIENRNSQEFMGTIGLYNWVKEHRRAEIGFWLLPPFWRQGYTFEALEEVIQYAFTQLKIHRIEAEVESLNTHSKNTLEKAGFKLEGTLKSYEIENGEFIDLDIYAILND